jgi:hypothetical protein
MVKLKSILTKNNTIIKTNVPQLKKMKKLSFLIIFLVFPINLYAYIDPGSGSALITAVLGFFAAIIYSSKKFFYNLKKKFRHKKD